MSKNIFNISEEYLRLMQEIEDNDGVVDKGMEERLHINKNEMENKIGAYHYIIKQKQAEIEMIEKEKERLDRYIKSKNLLIERLKGSVGVALELYGETGKSGNKTFKTATLSVWNVYHKPLIFTDKDSFDAPDYTKFTLDQKLTDKEIAAAAVAVLRMRGIEDTTEQANFLKLYAKAIVDITKIKEDLKGGVVIPGVILDEKANYIQIR